MLRRRQYDTPLPFSHDGAGGLSPRSKHKRSWGCELMLLAVAIVSLALAGAVYVAFSRSTHGFDIISLKESVGLAQPGERMNRWNNTNTISEPKGSATRAVVVPMAMSEDTDVLRAHFDSWLNTHNRLPCQTSNAAHQVQSWDLVLLLSGDWNDRPYLRESMQYFIGNSSGGGCFEHIRYFSCEIPPERDVYDPSTGQNTAEYNGPLLSFLCMFEHPLMSKLYDYTLMYEYDVRPTRANWLSAVNNEVDRAHASEAWFVFPRYVLVDGVVHDNEQTISHTNGAPSIYKMDKSLVFSESSVQDANSRLIRRNAPLWWIHKCLATAECACSRSCWGSRDCASGKSCKFFYDVYLGWCANYYGETFTNRIRFSSLFAHLGSAWQAGRGGVSLSDIDLNESVTLIHSASAIKEYTQELDRFKMSIQRSEVDEKARDERYAWLNTQTMKKLADDGGNKVGTMLN